MFNTATNAVFMTHRGFTDIFNIFGVLTYYYALQKWNTIYYITRDDAQDIVDYYVRDKPKIKPLYFPMSILTEIQHTYSKEQYHAFLRKILSVESFELLNVGLWDKFHTKPEMKDKWETCDLRARGHNFVRFFYVNYGLEYSLRVQKFEFTRDIPREEEVYNRFCATFGKSYSITHALSNQEIRTHENVALINIAEYSTTIFDCLTILENAVELHLLDSVWAAFVYLCAAKYGLFQKKRIVIYAKRGYRMMFQDPVKIPTIEIV